MRGRHEGEEYQGYETRLAGNFYFARYGFGGQLARYGQVLLDGRADVFEGFFFSSALGPASGQARTGHAETFVGAYESHFVLHTLIVTESPEIQ